MTTLTPVPPALTKPQLFRLVEIAHETKDEGIRKAALDLFAVETNPAFVVAADNNDFCAKLPRCGTCRHWTAGAPGTDLHGRGWCSNSASFRVGENSRDALACGEHRALA